jgi:hypothetical protein
MLRLEIIDIKFVWYVPVLWIGIVLMPILIPPEVLLMMEIRKKC